MKSWLVSLVITAVAIFAIIGGSLLPLAEAQADEQDDDDSGFVSFGYDGTTCHENCFRQIRGILAWMISRQA